MESRKQREAREAAEHAEWKRYGHSPQFVVCKLAAINPTYPTEITGDPACFFCGVMFDEPHDDDCIWLRAKAILDIAERDSKPPR